MPPDRFVKLVYYLSWAGCLLGVTAGLYLPANAAGFGGHWLFAAAVGSVAIGAALVCLGAFVQLPSQTNRAGLTLWVALLVILVLEVVLGLSPATPRDAPALQPGVLANLYAPWAEREWISIPKLLHVLYGFLTGLSLCAYLAHRLNTLYGLLGFLLFISTPLVFRLSHVAHTDLGLTYYVTASLICILFWAQDAKQSRWLVLAGASAGFAAATEANGLPALFFLAVALVYATAAAQVETRGRRLAPLGLFVLCALIALSPWVVADRAQLLESFSARASEPARYFESALNPMLILFLPWAFKGKWREEKRIFFGLALADVLFALFLGDITGRALLPAVPPLALLSVYAMHNIYLRIAQPRLLFAIVVLLLACNGVFVWHSFD